MRTTPVRSLVPTCEYQDGNSLEGLDVKKSSWGLVGEGRLCFGVEEASGTQCSHPQNEYKRGSLACYVFKCNLWWLPNNHCMTEKQASISKCIVKLSMRNVHVEKAAKH